MSDIIEKEIYRAANQLDSLCAQDPVDWAAFDAALDGLEDINLCLSGAEPETILSKLLWEDFWQREAVPVEMVRRFLSHGYDVQANGGANGAAALYALFWSVYDRCLLDAVRLLLDAGAPLHFAAPEAAEDEEFDLQETIDWNLAGAWDAYREYELAGVLDACRELVEARLAGKDDTGIDSWHGCIGRALTAVCAADGAAALQDDGPVTVFRQPLVLWFGDRPLVAYCCTEFVVNPLFAREQADRLAPVAGRFDPLLGQTLEAVDYIDSAICCFSFSGGRKLLFASRPAEGRDRLGSFELRTADEPVMPEQLAIDSVCGSGHVKFADDAVVQCDEAALALFGGQAVYLAYPYPGADSECRIALCRCSAQLIPEYDRLYPVSGAQSVACYYDKGELRALRLDCPEGCLYLKANEYNEVEVLLAPAPFDPLDGYSLFGRKSVPMKFGQRQR